MPAEIPGLTAKLIPSIDREADRRGRRARRMDEAERSDHVAGIGIDYRENDRPPELFWKAYRDACKAGFRTTGIMRANSACLGAMSKRRSIC